MRSRQNPQGIEPYLRDLRVHLLYISGLSGCAEDLSAPLAVTAARNDREPLLFKQMSKFSLHNQLVEIPLQGNRRFDEVNKHYQIHRKSENFQSVLNLLIYISPSITHLPC